ncbi:MAG: adenine-specific methyltransferase EcoRI family protein [Clostridia bacterium]|nr:adenine-specific methyltransferase EcoRI family protein [Clostridia bacterium]
MIKKRDLAAAKLDKKDEFYTQLTDIEKEMRYYRKHFKGKTVLCNCDDPFESNFFKYFVLNFNRLGLSKLIATCYATSPIMGSQLKYHMDGTGQMCFSFDEEPVADDNAKRPYKAVVTTVYDATGDGGVDMLDVAELFRIGANKLTELKGDGDYRSAECLELLKEADIVVTNPPFSKFREYIGTLMEYGKKFIIIGNVNAIAYKEIFPLLKDDQMWIGASIHSGDRAFYVPDDYPMNASGCGIDENGRRFIRVKGVRWYTNLDIKQRHEELILVNRYSVENYPKYENFDAINVDRVVDIPCDYDGIMGVPITFMDKYSPDQFKIIGLGITDLGKSIGVGDYDRKYKTPASRDGTLYYVKDGKGVVPYARVLIRNKHPEKSGRGEL